VAEAHASSVAETPSNATVEESLARSEEEVVNDVDLNISCTVAGTNRPLGGCVVHSHKDGSYSMARQRFAGRVGKQIDVIQLLQEAHATAYTASTWCIADSNHLTRSGNFVFTVGTNPASAIAPGSLQDADHGVLPTIPAMLQKQPPLDCASRSVDLSVGECTSIAMGRPSPAALKICYNGKAA